MFPFFFYKASGGFGLGSSVVSLAKMALLSGVAGNVQSQLDALASSSLTITGAAMSVVSDNLPSNSVVISTSTGKPGWLVRPPRSSRT